MESLQDSFEQHVQEPPTPDLPVSSPEGDISPDISPGISPGQLGGGSSPMQDDEGSDEEDSWFPWKSRAHFYLTVLYHGSHRR